jgi:predicted nucleic acid-binding protein
MSIVSNVSPFISLARLGQLKLLLQLYGDLTIPEAVWQEVVLEDAGQSGAEEIETASWIQVHPATNRELVQALRQSRGHVNREDNSNKTPYALRQQSRSNHVLSCL